MNHHALWGFIGETHAPPPIQLEDDLRRDDADGRWLCRTSPPNASVQAVALAASYFFMRRIDDHPIVIVDDEEEALRGIPETVDASQVPRSGTQE
jgi:hypothetical protein